MAMTPPVGVTRRVASIAVILAALLPHMARAGLGDLEASVATDAQQLKGSIKTTERTNYRMHEIQLPSGALLREYAGADGKVFAVAWNGPNIPNLRQVLGKYHDAFMAAAKTRYAGRTHLQIKQDDFVMQSSGHMRAFNGRAYLPQSVPAGTSLEELR